MRNPKTAQKRVQRTGAKKPGAKSLVLPVDSRGAVRLPSSLRSRLGTDGCVVATLTARGILIRPATDFETERYTPRRIAEFLLNNAADADDYRAMRRRVKRMGIDPDSVPHASPI